MNNWFTWSFWWVLHYGPAPALDRHSLSLRKTWRVPVLTGAWDGNVWRLLVLLGPPFLLLPLMPCRSSLWPQIYPSEGILHDIRERIRPFLAALELDSPESKFSIHHNSNFREFTHDKYNIFYNKRTSILSPKPPDTGGIL